MIIWEYELTETDIQILKMPGGAEILTVQTQDGLPYIWCLVDPGKEMKNRHIRTIRTGHNIETTSDMDYIGTYLMSQEYLVFHVFDLGEEE